MPPDHSNTMSSLSRGESPYAVALRMYVGEKLSLAITGCFKSSHVFTTRNGLDIDRFPQAFSGLLRRHRFVSDGGQPSSTVPLRQQAVGDRIHVRLCRNQHKLLF